MYPAAFLEMTRRTPPLIGQQPHASSSSCGWLKTMLTATITAFDHKMWINDHIRHSWLDLSLLDLYYKVSKKTLEFKAGFQSC